LSHAGAVERDGEERRSAVRPQRSTNPVDAATGTPRALTMRMTVRAELAPARAGAALACLALLSLGGCVTEYHPEYHPETSYSYVQNIVTVVVPPLPEGAHSPPPLALRSVDNLPPPVERHALGRPRASHTTPALHAAGVRQDHVQIAPVFVADDVR
jgi:hypothetical protein